MAALLWSYESDACREAGALPPLTMALDYGRRPQGSPFPSSKGYEKVWRAIESGYEVQPGDCPPIRLIAKYGWVLRCPATTRFRRLEQRTTEREFLPQCSRYGVAEVGGAPWPRSDSDYVASWIAGSEYVKVQTGIWAFFPADWCLYQGPIPNPQLQPPRALDVMAGIEPAVAGRSVTHEGQAYCAAMMNIICRLPPVGVTVELAAGDPLAWIFAVPSRRTNSMSPAPAEVMEQLRR